MRTLAAVAAIITLSLPLFLVYQAMNWSMAYSYTRTRGWRAEAVEHCPFTMIQVRQSKQPATVIRFDSLFAHGDGLLMPLDWNYGRTPGLCKHWHQGSAPGGFWALSPGYANCPLSLRIDPKRRARMDFEVNVRERILKPVNEVFDAVVDPKKMSNYFISGASGPIKVGRVEWEFGDL